MQTPIHPLTGMIREIVSIFEELDFSYATGPEAETEYYNFDALNIPENHPARDMWDTFWLKPENSKMLLRTHTSPVQIRHMESHQPPLRIIAPGKTYRYEATDMTHEMQFFQLEGLMIGEDVSLAHLKGTLAYFFKRFFSEHVEVRFRPSYFPFVEPGVEVDMRLTGEDVPERLRGKWIEIMGAGMVHPKVLDAAGIDSTKWQGFAFGAGIERFGMLKYGIDDIRLFHQGDLRFIEQFKPAA